jgi:hypothetical protein
MQPNRSESIAMFYNVKHLINTRLLLTFLPIIIDSILPPCGIQRG